MQFYLFFILFFFRLYLGFPFCFWDVNNWAININERNVARIRLKGHNYIHELPHRETVIKLRKKDIFEGNEQTNSIYGAFFGKLNIYENFYVLIYFFVFLHIVLSKKYSIHDEIVLTLPPKSKGSIDATTHYCIQCIAWPFLI